MKIVIDTNVLISALIKNSLTRQIIILYDREFLYPSFIFEEMEKHKDEILRKSGMELEQFNTLLHAILQKMHIVTHDILRPYLKQAQDIVKDIDPDDALFIACTLAYPQSILWSDDKKLKQQKVVPVINTKEMYLLFYGEP